MNEIKRMTKEEICKWYDEIPSKMSCIGSIIAFAYDCGILKEPVKKWRWWYTNDRGEYFVGGLLSEKEAPNLFYHRYGKCEGTEVEE